MGGDEEVREIMGSVLETPQSLKNDSSDWLQQGPWVVERTLGLP
jgi:hypothetical protein